MKKTIKQRFFLSLCLLMLFSLFGGGNLAWAEAITDYNNIVSGKKYYIRATTASTDYYLKVDGSTTATGKAGTAVTSEAEATVFVFEGSGTKWTIKFDGTENYLSLASGKANGKVNIVSSASTFTLSNQSGLIRITLGKYSIQKNSSSTATNFGSYANSQTDVWLEPVVITPLPTYNVSWMVNGESYTAGTPSTSVKKGESVTALPTEPAAIGSKVFVGWTDAQIAAAQSTAPDVLFTTPENAPAVTGEVTYYAVFATQSDSPTTEVLSQTLAYDTWTYGGSTTDKGTINPSYRLFHEGGYVQSKSFDLSTLTQVVVYGGTFGGDDYNTLEIGDGTNIWKTVTVSGSSQTGKNIFTDGSPLSGEGVLKITSQSGTTSDKGVRISKIEIYTLSYSYTDYVTTISSSPVTVTFNAGANGTCETTSLTETAAGAGVTLPVCVAKEGYKFVGWSTSETPTSADAGQAGATYHPSVDCTLYAYYKQLYTVTIEEPANGTIVVKHGENVVNNSDKFVAGDVLTITATPAEGYKFRYVQVEDGTPHTYTASNVKEWTMAEANITISAKFDEITYSTITKVVNGVSTTEQVENGTEIPFTDPDAASIPTGYVFMGWTETPVVGTQLDAPTLVSSPVTASTDATYYAVFATEAMGSSAWKRIKTLTDITDGSYVIKNADYILPNANSSQAPTAVAAPAIDDKTETITGEVDASMIWSFTTTGAANQFYVQNADGSYLYENSDGDGIRVGKISDKWTFAVNTADYFSMKGFNNNRYCAVNEGKKDWRSYTTPTYANYANDGKLELYKLTIEKSYSDYCTTIPDVQLAVGATGYATLYYSNYDLVVPANTEAYTFRSSNGALMESKTYAADEVIPAGEAVVVHTLNGLSSTLNFKKGIATVDCDASSQLAGTDEEAKIASDADYYFYGLSLNSGNDINSVGFYWMVDGGAAFTNGAHKAYLKIEKSEFTGQPVRGFAFKGTTTGVESVESSNNAPQAIYDLTGRRVSKAEKGIYIINGKKVIK